MYSWLLKIATYHGLEHTEVVRMACLELIKRYMEDPFLLEWMKDHEGKPLSGDKESEA